MKLYEIPSELERLIEDYGNAVTDEDRQAVANKMEALEMVRDEKINGILKSIRNIMAYKEAVKNEMALLKQKESAATNKLNRLRDFISDFFGGYKPAACTVPFNWTRRKKVFIRDENQVPEWAFKTPEYKEPEPKISLKEIEMQWKEGNEVPGTDYREIWVPSFPSKIKEEE